MDFSLSEEQEAIRGLAGELLDDQVTQESLRAVEDSETPGFDRALWSKLADAGLLGVCISEEQGGLGLGFLELSLLLEEIGRTVAPVPVLSTLAYGAMPLVRFGSAEQQAAILPGVASGETVLSGGYVEPVGDPLAPTTSARRDGGGGWVLHGEKTCVPSGLYADHLLVSATTDDGAGLFLVDANAAGVTRERQDTIVYAPDALITVDGAHAEAVGPLDGSALATAVQLATAAVSSVLTGVVARAVALTADYTKTREQFERPIALFQAVGQRAADSFIDAQTIRLTTVQAVWLLDQGLPASKEVAVAKFYASEAGQRIVRAAAHLHGGMGVSREYPLHRYYIWAKQLELTLGSGTRQLAALGRLLAEEPATA
jgi:alkylation response protein AidB-like acyl-CoA dehydrogenase